MMSLRTAAAKSSRMGLGSAASRSAISIPSTMAKGIVGSSSVRFKSAIPTSDSTHDAQSEAQSQGCPFTGSFTKQIPKLVEVPKLPFLGSRVPQYSGTPAFAPNRMYQHAQGMYQTFGDFFSHGVPGFGQGLFGTLYNITDPVEMLKVVRSEGAYPSGGIQQMWPLAKLFQHYNSPVVGATDQELGLLGQGPDWKTQRTFLQTGMLDPRAAKAFVPGIVTATEIASQGAPAAAAQDRLNYYLNLCAFDMFSAFMFGELTKCASLAFQETPTQTAMDSSDAENLEFCRAAIVGMETSSSMGRTPSENIAYKVFGYKTEKFRYFEDNWAVVRKIGMKKLHGFINRYHAGELTELERNSYMFSAMERLQNDGDKCEVSQEEMLELCLFAMFVGVDTTSGVTSWNLMHIALNPDVQQRLYEELSEAVTVTGNDGHLTAQTIAKRQTPYLNACLRENYRLTPPFGGSTFKRASQSDVEIHGTTVPKNSMVMLKNKYNDPAYLDDALEFKPERWLPNEIASRAGTPMEEMDHALFRDSFGQGARRCPGSRVATNEVLSMIAQLVLDYEIRPPANIQTLADVEYSMSALVTPTIPQLQFIPRKKGEMLEQESISTHLDA